MVVVDGTWWQARKLLKRNARLAALPQIRFTPPAPSNYPIRREPSDDCVATVEALAHVLGELEGAPERFAGLLRPFEAMIDTQIHYATHVRGARQRHALHRTRRERRPKGPVLLHERPADVVCLHGEANSWPARRPGGHPPEIVHWVARRAQSGETFEAIIAPRRPLAPAIPRHIGIARERLESGESWESFRDRWAAFARPADVVCSWGRYPLDVLESEGIAFQPSGSICDPPWAAPSGCAPAPSRIARRGLAFRRRALRHRARRRPHGRAVGHRRQDDGCGRTLEGGGRVFCRRRGDRPLGSGLLRWRVLAYCCHSRL